MVRLLLLAVILHVSLISQAGAIEQSVNSSNDLAHKRFTLVEEFTASSLEKGEILVGTTFELGMTDTLMIGTDIDSSIVGVPNIRAKGRVWWNNEHQVALGLRAAWLNKKTILWGSMDEHFDELDSKMIRPSVSWTNVLSPRLRLHVFWAKGFGKINAKLSEKGQRKLWEAKHPGADWESRDETTQAPTADEDSDENSDENQVKTGAESAPAQRSIQVQSLAGMAQERFQFTGEINRQNGNKILLACRIEGTQIEQLTSETIRATVAHHWIWDSFQMRLGVGAQYYVISGKDLDGEHLDETGTQPASDIAFYWRF